MEKRQTLREIILEAIAEARIMECARERYDEENMMLTAVRLSGAPYFLVQEVAMM